MAIANNALKISELRDIRNKVPSELPNKAYKANGKCCLTAFNAFPSLYMLTILTNSVGIKVRTIAV